METAQKATDNWSNVKDLFLHIENILKQHCISLRDHVSRDDDHAFSIFAADRILVHNRGNQRIILRSYSDGGDYWLELELGAARDDADVYIEHRVKITFGYDENNDWRGLWKIQRGDSPQACTLAQRLGLHALDANVDGFHSLELDGPRDSSPYSSFYLATIERMARLLTEE